MEDQVRRIRTSVEALLEERATLQQTIAALQQQNADLMKTLETKEAAFNALAAEKKRNVEGSVKNEAELNILREQINSYIKEIDQCIATLQGS